ncbi:hypothetical protein COT94_04010 [Candidatus Falkowbacteria bacterium CG10_big_fil_rev_8_21_14_0_10_37_14]|uniref:DUF5667 domain-containing protein n=1 Tax=Candidatus Falkowbacteria bacterium CG10_big_fil_rev_8_21_14_0_10_37_14 TaxID=1974561 RepID=A0A2M6WSH7_9BACT|nr:hypothetical protein [Candidatus Falkowbacteria bacterium]PIT95724.1 MAG: hypothetical protein COT94_04010 [Candidatus Falkowbacteria bacterium CG10_big_fil_rev_8_21_14_0_10_37_14]
MKKTLIAILMAMLVLPAIALTARAEDDSNNMMPTLYTQEITSESTLISEPEEEKIPNPGEIKNFTRIKKVGNALYGIRRVNSMINNSREQRLDNNSRQGSLLTDKQREVNHDNLVNNATEEKILSLEDVRYFTKIRKIGTSLYGIRMNIQGATVISADAIACVKTAMIKKDRAVLDAFDAYISTTLDSMATRSSAQLDALDITVNADRAKAMNAAIIANKKAKEEASRLRNQSVKTANDTYKTDLKSCRVNIGDDLDTSVVDSSL